MKLFTFPTSGFLLASMIIYFIGIGINGLNILINNHAWSSFNILHVSKGLAWCSLFVLVFPVISRQKYAFLALFAPLLFCIYFTAIWLPFYLRDLSLNELMGHGPFRLDVGAYILLISSIYIAYSGILMFFYSRKW